MLMSGADASLLGVDELKKLVPFEIFKIPDFLLKVVCGNQEEEQ